MLSIRSLQAVTKRASGSHAARLCVAMGVCIALLFHIGSTALYLMPENPIQKSFPLAHRYMETFFRQNWHLFSPDPLTESVHMWVKCSSREGETTEWFDPVDGITRQLHSSPFSPYQKLAFVYNHLVDHFADAFAEIHSSECAATPAGATTSSPETVSASKRLECAQEKVQQRPEYNAAARLAEQSCEGKLGSRPKSMQLRLVRTKPVPWDERDQMEARFRQPSEYVDFQPVEVP